MRVNHVTLLVAMDNPLMKSVSFARYKMWNHMTMIKKLFDLEDIESDTFIFNLRRVLQHRVEDLEYQSKVEPLVNSLPDDDDPEVEMNCVFNATESKIYLTSNLQTLKVLRQYLVYNLPAFHFGDAEIHPQEVDMRYPLSVIPRFSVTEFSLEVQGQLSQLVDTYHLATLFTPQVPLPLVEISLLEYAKGTLYRQLQETDEDARDLKQLLARRQSNNSLDLIADTAQVVMSKVQKDVKAKLHHHEYSTKTAEYDLQIISTDPVLHFTRIPLDFSNTLYRLHHKNKEEEHHLLYLERRIEAISVFQFFLLHTGDFLEAALETINLLSPYYTISDLDYFIEFLFLPELKRYQTKLLAYLLHKVMQPELSYRVGTELDLPEEVDLSGHDISQFRFINADPTHLFVRRDGFIVEQAIYDIDDYMERVHLGLRDVGITDIRGDDNRLRNAKQTLFVMIDPNPKYRYKPEVPTQDDHQVSLTRSKIRLDYSDFDSEEAMLSIYQLINTFMPLSSPDDLDIDVLTNQKFDFQVNGHKISIKFSDQTPGSFPTLDDLKRRLYINDYPLSNLPDLYRELEKISKVLRTVKMSTIAVDYVGVSIKHELFHSVFSEIAEKAPYQSNAYGISVVLNQSPDDSLPTIGLFKGVMQLHYSKKLMTQYFPPSSYNSQSQINHLDTLIKKKAVSDLNWMIDLMAISDQLREQLRTAVSDLKQVI